MICKGAETISDLDFNNFGGILLVVVALEGFSSLIPFLIFSMETFSNEKQPLFSLNERIFEYLGASKILTLFDRWGH